MTNWLDALATYAADNLTEGSVGENVFSGRMPDDELVLEPTLGFELAPGAGPLFTGKPGVAVRQVAMQVNCRANTFNAAFDRLEEVAALLAWEVPQTIDGNMFLAVMPNTDIEDDGDDALERVQLTQRYWVTL